MKKGKVFGKSQIAVTVMVLALAAAVVLNMKYSSAPKYLGEATYVSSSSDEDPSAVQTGAKAESGTTDSFADMKKERNKTRTEAQETIEETLKNGDLTDEQKAGAVAKVTELAARMEKETNIETLLKAKGFEKALAVIGDQGINIIVLSDGLTTAQTLQIQDVVTGETDISLSNIKIVPVKK